MSAIEILKDMINWRKKGIREFIFLHNTGGEMILEIERNVLGEALLALEKKENYKKEGAIQELERLNKKWDKLDAEPNVPLEFDVGHIKQYIEKRLLELKK